MKYGSKKISKAANIVLTSGDRKEVDQALSMIDDWRALHLQPLVELQNTLLQLLYSKKIRIFTVSRRLKRISSILNKLDRNPKSGLGTMQDIGGLRIVVHTMSSLEKALKLLENHIPDNFEIAKMPVNYIDTPKKESGYRSVHFIYKYKSSNNDVDGMKIELQLRTKLYYRDNHQAIHSQHHNRWDPHWHLSPCHRDNHLKRLSGVSVSSPSLKQ